MMAIETYNCLWIKNEGGVVITDLNVNNLSGDGRSEDEADEWDEHDWQVRARIG